MRLTVFDRMLESISELSHARTNVQLLSDSLCVAQILCVCLGFFVCGSITLCVGLNHTEPFDLMKPAEV